MPNTISNTRLICGAVRNVATTAKKTAAPTSTSRSPWAVASGYMLSGTAAAAAAGSSAPSSSVRVATAAGDRLAVHVARQRRKLKCRQQQKRRERHVGPRPRHAKRAIDDDAQRDDQRQRRGQGDDDQLAPGFDGAEGQRHERQQHGEQPLGRQVPAVPRRGEQFRR